MTTVLNFLSRNVVWNWTLSATSMREPVFPSIGSSQRTLPWTRSGILGWERPYDEFNQIWWALSIALMYSKDMEMFWHHKLTEIAAFDNESPSLDVLNTSRVITEESLAMRFDGHLTIRFPITSKPFCESFFISSSALPWLLTFSVNNATNFFEMDSCTKISLIACRSSCCNVDEIKVTAELRSADSVMIIVDLSPANKA